MTDYFGNLCAWYLNRRSQKAAGAKKKFDDEKLKEVYNRFKQLNEFVKFLKNTEKLYEEDIPSYTREKFNYKLDAKNIDVIKQIIEFKFDKKLAQKIISKSLDKIRTDLW